MVGGQIRSLPFYGLQVAAVHPAEEVLASGLGWNHRTQPQGHGLGVVGQVRASIEARQILASHLVSHMNSVLTYSRDTMCGTLRVYDHMLLDIRSGAFKPDGARYLKCIVCFNP